uniref:Uncharacterized protein n=1 Tax=Romanomermis culicivorax TaxID=13658 RepID=A0A915JV17_ROMCU
SSGQFKSTHGHHPLNTTSHGTNHSSELSSNEKSGENCTILYNSGSHGKHGNSSDESSTEGKNHTRGHRNSNGSYSSSQGQVNGTGSGVPAASRTSDSTSQGITGSTTSGYTRQVTNTTKSPTAAGYSSSQVQRMANHQPKYPKFLHRVCPHGKMPKPGPETLTQVAGATPEPGFGGGGPPPAGARTMTQLMTNTQSPITQEMSTIAQLLGKTKKPKKKKKQHTPSMRL